MAATILGGSDVWLSMITRVSFGALEVALQNRMDPVRSTSSRMMSACQPMVVAVRLGDRHHAEVLFDVEPYRQRVCKRSFFVDDDGANFHGLTCR